MTLDPFKPVPWESFTLIPTPKSRRPYPHALLVLVMVSVAVGGLVLALTVWSIHNG